MSERWLPVVGWEGFYEVSDHGHVRSLDRWIENPMPSGVVRRQFIRGRVLKPGIAKCGGYPYVNLSRNGKQVSQHVHRLVLGTFDGELPLGMQTRHLNGQPDQCHRANLRYGTPQENADDKIAHGTRYKDRCKRGHDYSNARITRDARGHVHRDCRACEHDRYLERKAAS